jgi:hypothetical protein
VGLELGPLSLVRINAQLLEKENKDSGVENGDQRPWGIHRADHATPLYPQKLALIFANQWRLLSWYSLLAG